MKFVMDIYEAHDGFFYSILPLSFVGIGFRFHFALTLTLTSESKVSTRSVFAEETERRWVCLLGEPLVLCCARLCRRISVV